MQVEFRKEQEAVKPIQMVGYCNFRVAGHLPFQIFFKKKLKTYDVGNGRTDSSIFSDKKCKIKLKF